MENLTNENAIHKVAEQPSIVVTLRKNTAGNEVLHFDGADEELDIDFTNSDQSSLRKLFCWLLDEQLKRRAGLKLEIDPSVKNATYQKIAEDYIRDLDSEMDSIFINEANAIADLTAVIGVLTD